MAIDYTERARKLLVDHRRALNRVMRNPDWSPNKRDQELQKVTGEYQDKLLALKEDIAAERKKQRAAQAIPTRTAEPDDPSEVDRAWDTIEPQLIESQSLAGTVGDLVAEAGERGDLATVAALTKYLPGYVHAKNRGESKQSRDTMIRGLTQLVEQQARPFLADRDRLETAKYTAKNDRQQDAKLAFLATALDTGVADPDAEIVLPRLDKAQTINVAGRRDIAEEGA